MGRRADARAARQNRARIKPPTKLERMYTKRLLRRVRMMAELLRDRLEPVLEDLAPGIDRRAKERAAAEAAAKAPPSKALPGFRGDADPEDEAAAREIERVVRATERTFSEAFTPDIADLMQVARGTDSFVTAQNTQAVAAVSAIPVSTPTATLAAEHLKWARENDRLIKSIDARFFGEVATLVAEAVREGKSTRSVAAAIRERTQVSRSRARLIARNEIGNLNAQITKARQTSLGITKYTWITMRDDVVRPAHEDREGVEFDWSNPPEGGHPGEDVNCRCSARPVIP